MKCNEARERFQAYADGELAAPEREQVQAHALTCPSCRRELDAALRIENLLRNQPFVAAPKDLGPAVIAKIKAGRAVILRRFILGAAAAAAGVLLAVGIGYRAWVGPGPEPAPAQERVARVAPAQTPDIDAALTALLTPFSESLAELPDYTQDVGDGVDWLVRPIASYLLALFWFDTDTHAAPSFWG